MERIYTLKILRATALLIAVAGTIAYQSRRLPVFASAASLQGDASTKAPGLDATSAAGMKVFQSNCAMCHGENLLGHPPTFPSLAGMGKTMNAQQITELVRHGRGMMPAFANTKVTDTDLAALLQYLAHDPTFTPAAATSATVAAPAMVPTTATPHPANDPGASIYQQNCAFCHGREAGGGESGPDLTRSKLVAEDVNGDKISYVVRNGRPDNKMPKFNLTDAEMADLVRWIHATAKAAATRPGGRRGVDVADLQTGNVAAGKQYFDGPGKCSSCHSPTGDLAGIASRYQGLQLEERMLYPKDAKDTLTVTLPSGQTVTGKLEYQDEFTVALRDSDGIYHSWPVKGLNYKIDSPVTAHVDLFPKYTDNDIHNLMAYIQTMK